MFCIISGIVTFLNYPILTKKILKSQLYVGERKILWHLDKKKTILYLGALT